MAHFLTTKNSNIRPVIIDESFIHRGLSFCDFGSIFLDVYIKSVPYPDVVFILDISKDQLLKRRIERDGADFKSVLERNGVDWFFNHVDRINDIAVMFEKRLIENGVTVIRLNANSNLSELKSVVLSEVFNKKRVS